MYSPGSRTPRDPGHPAAVSPCQNSLLKNSILGKSRACKAVGFSRSVSPENRTTLIDQRYRCRSWRHYCVAAKKWLPRALCLRTHSGQQPPLSQSDRGRRFRDQRSSDRSSHKLSEQVQELDRTRLTAGCSHTDRTGRALAILSPARWRTYLPQSGSALREDRRLASTTPGWVTLPLQNVSLSKLF